MVVVVVVAASSNFCAGFPAQVNDQIEAYVSNIVRSKAWQGPPIYLTTCLVSHQSTDHSKVPSSTTGCQR